MRPKFDRHIETKPLTRADAEKLHGSVFDAAGTPLTVEQIMRDPSWSKVHRVRDIDTGKMKLADENHNATSIPFFVVKAH